MSQSLKKKIEKVYRRVILSATRVTLNKKLPKVLKEETHGSLLEIGAQTVPYKNIMNYTEYACLDVKGDEDKVDYIQDLHKTTLESDAYDSIVMVEVLEHLYNPFQAMEQVHRICKKGGTVIATTRFLFPYHGVPYDYFRYTEYGIKQLFKEFDEVTVKTHGNLMLGVWDIITSYPVLKLLRILSPVVCFFFASRKENQQSPLGFIVIAKK